jgi:4-hydroxy-4-methyl-2-oxoglutarate aldolase
MVEESLIGKIFTSPDRPNDERVSLAAKLGVSGIVSGAKEPWGRDHLMEPVLHRVVGSGCIAGRAVTAWNPPGNNTSLGYAMEMCRPGDVLVIATPTDGTGQFGGLSHEWANKVGLAGVIVDGSVRDVAEQRAIGVSLWARSINPGTTLHQSVGYVNAPIRVAGVRVSPGDVVVADDDGVIVIPDDDLDWVLAGAKARYEKEISTRKNLIDGNVPEGWTKDLPGIERVGHPWSANS